MSKRRIEQYIPKAIEYLEESFEGIEVPKEYSGYISSFGAGLVQSGLIPTVAFYENENSSANQNREKLTKIILKLINDEQEEGSLLSYIIQEDNKENLKAEVKDAAIAVKLALRTFKLSEDEGGNNE